MPTLFLTRVLSVEIVYTNELVRAVKFMDECGGHKRVLPRRASKHVCHGHCAVTRMGFIVCGSRV